MPVQNKPYPVVDFLIETFGDWLKHRRELNEMRQMDTGDFDRIASELQVTPADLNELVRRGPHAADELPRLLKALGIDKSDIARTEPLVLRDMQRVCALCNHKCRCDADLAAGFSAEDYKGYCANAPTIESLGREAGK